MIDIRPVATTYQDLIRYQSLFDETFGPQPKFHPEALNWLYVNNPAGSVIGFDAFDQDLLVAHYVCVPVKISHNGRLERGLLSLNTATRASHQGKGLFVKLAEATYQRASLEGFNCVIGVANANSTPGFLRKLGFSLVAPLQARIEIGAPAYDPHEAHKLASFFRVWDAVSLKWRSENPANKLRYYAGNNSLTAVGNAFGPFLSVQTSLPLPKGFNHFDRGIASPFRVSLGLVPEGCVQGLLNFDIPFFLRPSPLNFIFKDLSGEGRLIDKGKVFFSFLDFDAY